MAIVLLHSLLNRSMQIRPAEPRDRSEWLRMRAALWPGADAEHAAEIDEFLRAREGGHTDPAAVLVGSSSGESLCGFIELSVRSYAEGCAGSAPYVEGWYVDPQVRGEGKGRGLMQAAEEWARERGYRELASDTELENAASQQAHLALGFEEVERAVHFRKDL